MSTITPTQSPANSADSVPEPAHPVSELIDATETLYRFTVDEYEQIAGFLHDDRVELIDGYLVKKMVKNPPHVVACARVVAAVARIAPAGWHTRPGEPIRIAGRTEPEPDVALARGVIDDYEATTLNRATSRWSSKSQTPRWPKTAAAGELMALPVSRSTGSSTW